MTQFNGNSNPASLAGINLGDKIDKFEIVDQIGAGGTSIVWKGHDRLLNRFVAIKQLAPEMLAGADDDYRERFRQEAALQKKITDGQPALVQVYEFVEDDRGLFIVMEYVDGVSLDALLSKSGKPLDVPTALGIVGAAAMALEVLHQANIVHRDLKPSNILLPKAGGLKLCDFGLATLVGDQDALSIGTVRYMAPELSRSEPAAPRSDIYSLGIIAYEMLAGRSKFEDAFKIVMRDQRNQALRWMKWHTNIRAKAPALPKLNPQVNETLGELVARMMEKDPALRIGSCSDLLGAIRRHFAPGQETASAAEGAPVVAGAAEIAAAAGAVASANPTAALPTPSRLPLILGAILGVQLLIGLGFYMVSQNRQQAAVERVRAAAQSTFMDARQRYDDGHFGTAKDKFDALALEWPKDPVLGVGSEAFAQLCQARLDLEAQRFDAALAGLLQVRERSVLKGDYQRDVQRLIDETTKASAFAREVQTIQQFMTEGRFDLARQRLNEQRRLALRPAEEKQLADLAAQIEDQVRKQRIDNILAEANRRVDSNELESAISYLEEARADHPNHKLDTLLEDLKRNRSYAQARSDAARFTTAGQLEDAIRALQRAQKIKKDDAVATQINELRSRLAYQQARAAQDAGDLTRATQLYTQALGFADNPAAREALAKLETAGQKAAFLRAGDDAFAAGDYSSAVKQYQNALKLGPDADIRTKLVASQVRQQVMQGRSLMEQGKLEEAAQVFAEVSQTAPDDAELRTATAALTRQRDYLKALKEGDAAREQSKFGEAKRLYMQARQVMTTPEIEQRITDTEYEHFVAQGRGYMGVKRWTEARAALRSAMSVRPTDEVRQLLEEVANNLPRDLNNESER